MFRQLEKTCTGRGREHTLMSCIQNEVISRDAFKKQRNKSSPNQEMFSEILLIHYLLHCRQYQHCKTRFKLYFRFTEGCAELCFITILWLYY